MEHSETALQNFLKTRMHQRRTDRKGPSNTLRRKILSTMMLKLNILLKFLCVFIQNHIDWRFQICCLYYSQFPGGKLKCTWSIFNMKIKCISTLIRISMLTKQASRNGLHSTTRSQIWYIRFNDWLRLGVYISTE